MDPIPWIVFSATVIAALGAAHLAMLHTTPKLRPADPSVSARLESATVPLSDATNMGRLWTGFNTSHALGALSFGATYASLALTAPQVFRDGTALSVVGLVYLGAMLWASIRYWFRLPSVGIGVATVAFAIGAASAAVG